MKKDGLGDRIKSNYENRGRFYLTRRTPVMIRLDGKAFHTYTKYCKKPYDLDLIEDMTNAAFDTAKKIQGCVAFYHQSDEVTFLLTDYQNLESDAWFDYNKSKIETITSSMMTAHFNCARWDAGDYAYFDARSFNIPKEEVVNAFLWRIRDWTRNSVAMAAQSMFSHKELHGKNITQQKEMLLEKDFNWEELSHQLKYGSLYINEGGTDNFKTVQFDPTYEGIAKHFEKWV